MRVGVLLVAVGLVGAGCSDSLSTRDCGPPRVVRTDRPSQPNVPLSSGPECDGVARGGIFMPVRRAGSVVPSGNLDWQPGDTPPLEWCRVLCGIGCGTNCLPEGDIDGGPGYVVLGCNIANWAEPLPPTCAPSLVSCTTEDPVVCAL